MRDHHDVRMTLVDQGADRGLEGVGVELRRGYLDGEDLVDSLKGKRVGKPLRRRPDDRHGDLARAAAQGLRGSNELERDGPQFAAPLFGDDQDSAHGAAPLNSRMISARRCACCATSPEMSSARPLSGMYMRRTREAEPASPTSPAARSSSVSDNVSMGCSAVCLMLLNEAYRGVLIPNWIVNTAGH